MDKSSQKSGSDDSNDENKERSILGIHVISSIVSRAISDTSQILSALKQILFFYNLLPPEWKKKAFYIFEKLWNKYKVTFSTNPEQPRKVYEITFEDKKLRKLYETLPPTDQAIMLQGRAMLDLISKGLHGESDEIKKDVEERYNQRGLNIVNMLTTKDIDYLLEEIGESFDPKQCIAKFNEWASQYDSIALLVSPSKLADPEKVKRDVINLSIKNIRPYALVNLSGKMEDCTRLLNIISDLKEKKALNYYNAYEDISDSGFCKSLRVRIDFKNINP